MMRPSTRLTMLAAVAAATALASCAGGSEWSRLVQWKDYTLGTLPERASFPGEGAVILLDEGRMEPFGSGILGYTVFEQHRIVRLFDTRGERFANVVLPYNPTTEIEDLQARTITPSGTIVPLRPEDVHDVSLYPEFVFFSDQRAKIFTMPAVEPGAVLEYRYRMRVHNRTVWHGWRFQHEVPTLISRFTMLVPSEWPVSFRTYGIELEPEVQRVPNGFKSTFRWETRDVPGLHRETGMPPASERFERLAIAPLGFTTWNDVAAWYRNLSEPSEEEDSGIAVLVDSLLVGVSDQEARMRIIYQWVRDHVRYLAVEIGIGGYQPHAAGAVCANRYGDCKDMATILAAMGEAAGIRVDQVLISTWQNGMPDTSLPSPYQFNHAISYAPDLGQGRWMDATAKGTPYGELPWYDQGAAVLVVGEDGTATILVTPIADPKTNTERVTWKVSLDDHGHAQVRARTELTGALASEARDELAIASERERKRWVEAQLPPETASSAIIDTFSLRGLVPVEDPLVVEIAFTAPVFAVPEDTVLRFRPGMMIASGLPDLFRAESRTHPVRLRFGMQRELLLELTLPPDWHVAGGVRTDSTGSAFGWWRTEVSPTARGAHIHRVVSLEGGEIAPSAYVAYKEFLDTLRRSELRTVTLAPDPAGR